MSRPTNAAIVDLNGRTWQPFEATSPTGHVTFSETEGEIHVPYGTDPVSLTIQAHELAHVRYSAKVWPNIQVMLPRLAKLAGTTYSIVGYAEDMRITALAGRLGIKTLPEFGVEADKPIIDGWVKSFVDAGVPEDRVQRAVRFILNNHTSVLDAIGLDLATLQQKKNAEAYIVHCAGYIHELLSRGGKSDEPKNGDKGDSRDKGKGDSSPGDNGDDAGDEPSEPQDGEDGDSDEAGDDESKDGKSESKSESAAGKSADKGKGKDKPKSDAKPGKPSKGTPSKGDADGVSDAEIDLSGLKLPDIRQSMLKSVPAPVDTEKLIQTFQHTLDTANWIPVVKIDRMPLVRRAAQATRKGRKLSETGVALGSAYDAVAPNERRPFVSKRRGGAGGLTVVVDCSGSMHIDDSELEQLLLKYPQGVVVTYSSYVSRGGTNRAVVRVIASHGRLAATHDFRDDSAGGNGCDGPVLEWLAKQSGERVWVCDGVITEHEDHLVSYDYNARDAWLKAHRIKRFDNLTQYLESLSKR